MYFPSRAEFQDLARRGNLVPVYRELPADLDTPVSVYLKLRGIGESFLLESVEGGEQLARYSFIGSNPARVLRLSSKGLDLKENGSVRQIAHEETLFLDVLQDLVRQYCSVRVPGLPRFTGGAVGYLAYDMVRQFERIRTSGMHERGNGQGASNQGDVPDAIFMLTDTLVAFDHVKHRAIVIANASIDGDPDAAYDDAIRRIDALVAKIRQPLPAASDSASTNGYQIELDVTASEFAEAVRRAQEHIAAGDIFQVVLSLRIQRETNAEPFHIYRALRRLNPSPYMFFLDFGETQFIGASPEMLVRLEDNVAQLNPIAGTRRRGTGEQDDGRLEAELRADPKERAEHVMLVDLGRNDLGRVCEFGSIEIPDFMTVERYSHVMHLVSRVTGRLRPDVDAFDLLKATFPAGTVSGAPKVRAMEIIDQLEPTRRGPYAGAVGYFGFPTIGNPGSMDFCIAIRTIVMRASRAFIQAGAGIVADSIPDQEYQECLNKAGALAEAIRMAETEEAEGEVKR